MLATVFEIAMRRLRHNRVELLLTFVVPIVFFSIFALIFSRGVGSTPRVKTWVFDRDRSELSAKLVASLEAVDGLRVTVPAIGEGEDAAAWAESAVLRGQTAAAVLIPAGFADAIQSGRRPPPTPVLIDSSNPVAEPVVSSLLLQAISQTIQTNAAAAVQPIRIDGTPEPAATEEPSDLIATRDIVGEGKDNAVVASYASGIAVLFLLFSAAGAGGSLLEEQESGTLERLLSSRLSMPQLLLGKWVYIVALGVLQVTAMFAWGQAVFGVDLMGHLPGFAAMTLVTSAAAASFALVLATVCRSRTQLSGVSTIIILSMSALGGSMVPRYLMSESMQRWGLVTFNAWALDGYNNVFWRDMGVAELQPQLLVLTCAALAMMILARVFARRWECG